MTKRPLLLALLLVPAATLAYRIDGPGYTAPPVRLPVRVVTVYHATVEQTDGDPFTTADGTTWDAIAEQRIAALSREMLDRWGGPVSYGDAIWVEIPGSDLSGVWWVHDTMRDKVYKRATGTWEPLRGYVDLLVPAHVMGCWQRGMRVYLIGGKQ